MAATRLLHHFARKQSHNSPFNEASYRSLPFSNIVFERYSNLRRRIQTQSEPSIEGSKAVEEDRVSGSKAEAALDSQTNAQIEVNHTSMSNLKVSSRHDLAMIFTCKVCETRSMKTCCRESYEKGVVIVRCSGCNNLHLMSDRIGRFGKPESIEDLLAARGEEVKKGSVDSLNFTLAEAGKNL